MKDYPKQNSTADKIRWILAVDPQSISNTKRFGTIFDDAGKVFSDIQRFLERIDLDRLGQYGQLLNSPDINIGESLNIVANQVSDIQNATTSNASKVATSCKDRLTKKYHELITRLGPYWPVIGKEQAINTSELEKITKQAKKTSDKINKYKEQAEQGAAAITTTAGQSGIAKEAAHFSKESELHHANAQKWLKTAGYMGALLITVALYFLFCLTGMGWDQVLSRFSVLGILVYFEAVLIGIYKAERHNTVVNKHRANALKTFEVMTAATLTQDVKDAVTLTAAEAIYAPQETGFSKHHARQAGNAAGLLTSISTKTRLANNE